MKKALVLFILPLLFLLPLSSSAAVFTGAEEYTLGADDSLSENLYVGAATVVVAGDVVGDVFAGGAIVTVTGAVDGDLFVGGDTVNILGSVSGDVRAGGSNIIIGEDVQGDLLVGGAIVHILPGVTVHGDAMIGAGRLIVDGTVKGEVTVGAEDVSLNGTFEQGVNAYVNQVNLGDSAVIKGDFSYESGSEAEISETASIEGETFFEKSEGKSSLTLSQANGLKRAFFKAFGFFFFMKLLAFLTAAILIVLFFKKPTEKVVRRGVSNFGKELLRGLVVFIVTPIAIILLFATLLGSFAAVLAGLVYVFMLCISKLLATILFGVLLVKLFNKKKPVHLDWKIASLGVVSLLIVVLVPVIGWIVGFAFFLNALGSLSYEMYRLVQAKK